MIKPYFKSEDKKFTLLHGDTMDLLPKFEHKFDMIFADPPYFLSNDGLSIQSGEIVSVNKGKWDKSEGIEFVNDFNRRWLKLARDKMKEDATIWISGTMHNIFSVGQILTELDFKILNIITWEKSNPPPNFSCRFFTHSTEQIIWARKNKKVPHYFNYELMKELNGNKQMKDVWKLPAIAPWEKSCKKHPTQKPLSVLTRIILASTKPNAWILDPFTGSSTTGIAASLANRRFLGIDQEKEYLEISKNRKFEIEKYTIAAKYRQKIQGFNSKKQLDLFLSSEINDILIDEELDYGVFDDLNLSIINKSSFQKHPSKRLNDVFLKKSYQGANPKDAKTLFIDRNTSWTSNIEEKEVFDSVVEYLEDGITFWTKNNIHHPFLLSNYKGFGKRYHQRFSKLNFDSSVANKISFVDLIGFPTTGMASSNMKCFKEYLFSEDNNEHLIELDKLLNNKDKVIFIAKGLIDDFKLINKKTGLFESFAKLDKEKIDVKDISQFDNVFIHQHFSGAISNATIIKIENKVRIYI